MYDFLQIMYFVWAVMLFITIAAMGRPEHPGGYIALVCMVIFWPVFFVLIIGTIAFDIVKNTLRMKGFIK